MEPAQARELFSNAERAYLASVRPDGGPHIVPFTFVVAGDVIYSAVDSKPKKSQRLQRLINIESQPRVSALADAYSREWSGLWWVRADGTAALTDESEGNAVLGMLRGKYSQYEEEMPPGPVLSISVERWSGWAAS